MWWSVEWAVSQLTPGQCPLCSPVMTLFKGPCAHLQRKWWRFIFTSSSASKCSCPGSDPAPWNSCPEGYVGTFSEGLFSPSHCVHSGSVWPCWLQKVWLPFFVSLARSNVWYWKIQAKESQIINCPRPNSLGRSSLFSNWNWLNPNPLQIPLPKSLCEAPLLVRVSKKTSAAFRLLFFKASKCCTWCDVIQGQWISEATNPFLWVINVQNKLEEELWCCRHKSSPLCYCYKPRCLPLLQADHFLGDNFLWKTLTAPSALLTDSGGFEEMLWDNLSLLLYLASEENFP